MTKILISAFLSLSFVLPVAAQVPQAIKQNARDTRQNVREEIRDKKQDVREEVREAKENVRENVKEAKTEVRENIKEAKNIFEAKRVELRKESDAKREEVKKNIEVRREEAKKILEQRKTELKERLQNFKDEKKKEIIERIGNQLNELNKRRTDHFLDVVAKIEKALERIISRADKAEANGLNVSAVRTAITEAQNAIAASRIAIEVQTTKVYEVITSTTTEEGVKADVGSARQALQADLKATQETVKAAHEAVKKAATALAQIPKVNEEPAPAPVATSTESSAQ